MQTSPTRSTCVRCGLITKLVFVLALLGINGELWATGWPPWARNDEASVPRGGTVSVLSNGSASVLANDFDREHDTLTAVLTSDVDHGELIFSSDGTFSYSHNGNFATRDEFRYRAFDGTGFSREARVTINIIAGDPIPPVIVGQSDVIMDEDSSREIRLRDLEVFDPDSRYPQDFTLEVSDGENYSRSAAVITPLLNFFGQLSVPVRVFDGTSFSQPFQLVVDVRPRNDAPFVVGDVADQESFEGVEFVLPLSGFFSDIDKGDTLRFSARGLPPSNSLRIDSSSGVLSGTPVRGDGREIPYDVDIFATDSAGATARLSFLLIVFPDNRADISVSAAVIVNPVTVGETAEWNINIENMGPADLSEGDLVASWATSGPALSLSTAQSCSVQNNATRAPVVRCALGGLMANTSVTINVQGTQSEDGDNTLIAQALVDDRNPTNNAAMAASQIIAEFSEGPTQILNLSGTDIDGGDVNGDGHIDFIATSHETFVFLNNGNRELITPGTSLGPETGGEVTALLDWNGDGTLDIAVGGMADRSAGIFVNDGNGVFASAARLQNGGVGQVYDIATADLDLDGSAELILTGSSDTIIMRWAGHNNFDLVSPPVGAGIDVTTTDVNQDGYPDLIVVESADRAVAVLANSGNGNTFERTRLRHGSVRHVSTADINDDGPVDLLFAIDGSDLGVPENLILYQQDNGGFVAGGTFGASAVAELLTGDVNADGWPDVIAVNEAGVHQIYQGSASGDMTLTAEQIVSSGMRHGVLLDFNGDESLDLIMAGGDVIEIHANNGIGRLGLGDRAPPEITLIGEASVTIAVGEIYIDEGATARDDIDGDLTESIVTSGSVDTAVVGTYSINYSVADRAGNSTSAHRTVTVKVNAGVGGGGGGAMGPMLLLSVVMLLVAQLYVAGSRRPPFRRRNRPSAVTLRKRTCHPT